jgi:hypothetical protein
MALSEKRLEANDIEDPTRNKYTKNGRKWVVYVREEEAEMAMCIDGPKTGG